ncbi:MAG: CgeB family protein [Candidatus Binataceae bacterium]
MSNQAVRILLFDTSAHALPWPLFLQDLEHLATELPDHYAYSFVDEAAFLEPRSIVNRALTRGLDWLTINVEGRRTRRLAYETAARFLGYRRHAVRDADLNRKLLEEARVFAPELVLVVMGFHIWPRTVAAIKRETGAVIVNYATDDPFNGRTSTRDLRAAIPLYDVYACTKMATMDDVVMAGCSNVQYLRFGFQPSVHFVDPSATAEEQKRFAADVAFVGEGDADRVPFFRALMKAIPSLNLALYGGLWELCPALRRFHRGTVRGRDFRLALGGAKIAVNLVRVQNRDDHVMRSFEGPACGAFMLNERTEEHLALFAEGREAAYFESPEELAEKVRYYLNNDSERERIRKAGHTRTITGSHTYRDRLMQILQMVEPAVTRAAIGRVENCVRAPGRSVSRRAGRGV